MSQPRLLSVLAFAAACVLSACASTTFSDSWKAPEQPPLDPRGQKVAAVFISMDEGTRRAAEDELVRRLNEHGATGVASYLLVPGEDLRNQERVRERLLDAGVDGVVSLRIIDEKQKITVSYGNLGPAFGYYNWRFSDYWDYGWDTPYAPAEVTTTTILRIETLLYSIKRDTLLWAGTSRTSNPSRVTRLVEEVAHAAARQMTKQGLLLASEGDHLGI